MTSLEVLSLNIYWQKINYLIINKLKNKICKNFNFIKLVTSREIEEEYESQNAVL